ncbi:MAG TPA: tetratricopeptide repeat protein, partial [Candidatus Udaeobacter sp.]|nr:tetratricopeptide repeat protein [Candidatus Udaeobacter sp.]
MKRRQRVMLLLAVLVLVAPTSLMAQTSTTQTAPAQTASPLDPVAKVCSSDPNPDKRIAACNRLIAALPKGDPRIHRILDARGVAYFSKGEIDHAIHDYDAALKLNPRDPVAYNNRAFAHFAQGQ